MDVRGLGGDGLLDEEVDQPDDRGLEGHVAKLGDVLLAVAVAVRGPHALDDLLQRGGGAVGALDGLEDGLPRRDAERDVERQGLAQLVDEERIGGVGGRDGQGRALEGDRAGRVLPQVLGGEVLQHRRREGQLLGGEEREPALGGERPEDIVLGGGAQLDQGIADPLTGIARARLGERQHLGGDDTGLEQRLSEILRRDRGRPVYRHNSLIMRVAPEGVKKRETAQTEPGPAVSGRWAQRILGAKSERRCRTACPGARGRLFFCSPVSREDRRSRPVSAVPGQAGAMGVTSRLGSGVFPNRMSTTQCADSAHRPPGGLERGPAPSLGGGAGGLARSRRGR